MKEGTTLGARAQSAIERAAVLYKPRLETFKFNFNTVPFVSIHGIPEMHAAIQKLVPKEGLKMTT
jgi:hypothetical protein